LNEVFAGSGMYCGASHGGDCAELGTGTPCLQGRNFGRSSIERYRPSNLPEETKRSRNRPPFRNLLEGFVLSMQSSYSQLLEPACLQDPGSSSWPGRRELGTGRC
jgi:hypothetical protein